MKFRKFSITLLLAALCIALVPISAFASESTISLNPIASVKQGGNVVISGTSTLNEVIIKVLRPENAGMVYYDIAKVEDGRFSVSFTLPVSEPAGTYPVVAGQASQVSTQNLVVTAAEVVVPPVNPPVDPPVVIGPGGGGGGGAASGGGSVPSAGAKPEDGTGIPVMINGKTAGSIATAISSQKDGKTVVTVTVDAKRLEEQLNNAVDKSTVIIPVTASSDRTSVILTGDAIKALENKNAILEIRTPNGIYKLPASEVWIDQLAKEFGAQTKLSDIIFQVDIAKGDEAKVKLLANAANEEHFTIMVPPVDFKLTASFNGKSVNVNQFRSFVEREILVPEGVDADKITTAVVLQEDGSIRSVPTKIVIRNGISYAVINSLTNSTYSLVWNPVTFSDVEQHWSKDAVNDMGSRMVISGIGNGLFSPDRDITRAEFAAIIVRGLGLKPQSGASQFSDVKQEAWYNDAIRTAHAYGLIGGFEDGTFRPNDKITREQVMVIIAKAMEITKLQGATPEQTPDLILQTFADADKVSNWAKNGAADSIQAGIVSGRGNNDLAPKAFVTRAEVALILKRLLKSSDLI